jgi:hypothetical protein
MKIARPAARKSTGRSAKPSKSGASRQGRKSEPPPRPAEAPAPRRRFVEPPKVVGELPTPTATFYF